MKRSVRCNCVVSSINLLTFKDFVEKHGWPEFTQLGNASVKQKSWMLDVPLYNIIERTEAVVEYEKQYELLYRLKKEAEDATERLMHFVYKAVPLLEPEKRADVITRFTAWKEEQRDSVNRMLRDYEVQNKDNSVFRRAHIIDYIYEGGSAPVPLADIGDSGITTYFNTRVRINDETLIPATIQRARPYMMLNCHGRVEFTLIIQLDTDDPAHGFSLAEKQLAQADVYIENSDTIMAISPDLYAAYCAHKEKLEKFYKEVETLRSHMDEYQNNLIDTLNAYFITSNAAMKWTAIR